MKVNENTAIASAGVLLVPYERHHVPTYHAWMEDEVVRTATASDRLTLDEEFENQESWRTAADKLTFIVCRPLADAELRGKADDGSGAVVSRVDDAPDHMVGDINFFLYPWVEDDGNDDDQADDAHGSRDGAPTPPCYSGEIDVMIARTEHRRQGLGRAAVTAFLHYILMQHRAAILSEAVAAEAVPVSDGTRLPAQLKHLVVKIQATNEASIGLFKSLGFEQHGGVNYFGEIKLVRSLLEAPAPDGYREMVYQRATC